MIKIFLLLFLYSCATTGKYEEKLNTWIGADESLLLNAWGIPSREYKSDNMKLLMYQYNGGSFSTANPIGNSYWVNTTSYYCNTTFYINEYGKIQYWRYEGNSCKSK